MHLCSKPERLRVSAKLQRKLRFTYRFLTFLWLANNPFGSEVIKFEDKTLKKKIPKHLCNPTLATLLQHYKLRQLK